MMKSCGIANALDALAHIEMERETSAEETKVECWQCGGEGRVAGTCIDGCCVEQDDPYCEYCSHRCDICRGTGAIKTGED